MRPKKSFGQNFLINEGVCQRIVKSFIEQNPCENVLEVGPGKGALTKYLLEESSIHYKAIEADWDMVHYLQQNFHLDENSLIYKDFLKLPLETVFDKKEYAVIGNFPYNISTQILFKIEKYKDCVPFVLGMFQREVAERIASNHGSKVYGVISILLQAFYEVKIHFHISPSSFFPAPKVTSTIISLRRKENFELPCDEKLFKSVVKTSFNQRRKMLRNTLKPFIRDEAMLSSEFFTKRPEQLSVEDFFKLTNQIHQYEQS